MRKEMIFKIFNLIILSAFTIFLTYYLIQDNFRLTILFRKYFIEFFFLLLTGYFLTSFSYDLMGIKITFNAFIIYASNNILKTFNMKGIELIYLFIIIYFATQNLLIFFVFNRIKKDKIIDLFIKIFSNIFMWCILITLYNYILNLFEVNISQLRIMDIFVALIIIILHNAIKTLFVITELISQKKLYFFFYHSLPYFIVDSLFIYFSIILGSVYHSIGILNTAFFIIFLAITMSLIKFFTRIEAEHSLFYSIHSFLNIDDTSSKLLFDHSPLNITSIEESINYTNESHFVFLVADYGDEINIWEKKNAVLPFRFYLVNKRYLYTIRPFSSFNIDNLKIKLEETFKSDIHISYCKIPVKSLILININYIFRILSRKLKNMNDSVEILEVGEKEILF